jgi:hypothetical protein
VKKFSGQNGTDWRSNEPQPDADAAYSNIRLAGLLEKKQGTAWKD